MIDYKIVFYSFAATADHSLRLKCLPHYQITVDSHPEQIAMKAIKDCKPHNTWRPTNRVERILMYF